MLTSWLWYWLQSCKILPSRETKLLRLSLYYCLQLHVSLQLSPSKIINFKRHLQKSQKQHISCGSLLPTESKFKLFIFKFPAPYKQIPDSLSNLTFRKSTHTGLITGYSWEFLCLLLHSVHLPTPSPHPHAPILPSFQVHLQMAHPAGGNPSLWIPTHLLPCIIALYILVLYSPQSYELFSDETEIHLSLIPSQMLVSTGM